MAQRGLLLGAVLLCAYLLLPTVGQEIKKRKEVPAGRLPHLFVCDRVCCLQGGYRVHVELQSVEARCEFGYFREGEM